MNPALFLLFTNDKALRWCLMAAVMIALVPMMIVLTITQVGAQAISDVLLPHGENTNPTSIPTIYGLIELENPAIWPVGGVITQEFGTPNFPFQVAHTGIDIANPNGAAGDPVRAILPGKIVFAGEDFISRNLEVHVDHGQGLVSVYAHLSKITAIKGQEVLQGQKVGEEGRSGWATGVHLHLELRLFHIPVNPRVLIGQGSPPLELP